MGLVGLIAAILAFIAFLIWNGTRASLERRKQQLEAQARVLDRIGPGPALAEFLKTEEGQKFLSQIAAPEPRGKDARGRIFMLTTLGLVALFGGLVFVNAALLPTILSEDPEIPVEVIAFTALPAFLAVGAGAGALVAAWLMHRLSKKWGMLNPQGQQ